MNAPSAQINKEESHEETRVSELGPARKRDRLLQHVLAARKRLPQVPRGPFVRAR